MRWNKNLEQIVELMQANDLSEIEIGKFFTKIRIVRNAGHHQNVMYTPAPLSAPELEPTKNLADKSPVVEDRKLLEVTSPTVGTFYAAPAPDKPPFVITGDRVRAGQILCIVEAMKILNEIPSEHTGKIAEVCVNNEDPVEFGQVIFRIEAE